MGHRGLIFGMIGIQAFGFKNSVVLTPNIRPKATCQSERLEENDRTASAFINYF
jgi:hypothetical protein